MEPNTAASQLYEHHDHIHALNTDCTYCLKDHLLILICSKLKRLIHLKVHSTKTVMLQKVERNPLLFSSKFSEEKRLLYLISRLGFNSQNKHWSTHIHRAQQIW